MRKNLFATLEHNEEFMSLSADCTLKVCMTVQAQASYRASAAVRNASCFNDQNSLRRVLTIRGRTGAVLAMHPVPNEDAEKVAASMMELFSQNALSQVKLLSSDNPSAKLLKEVKEACSNLICLSLDPVHLAIVYEYGQWGKKSAGSRVLRQLLRKFTQVDPSKNLMSWGPFFTGAAPSPLTREELKARDEILHISMGHARAKRILENLDATLRCVLESHSLRPWLRCVAASLMKSLARSQAPTKKLPKCCGRQQHRTEWSGC